MSLPSSWPLPPDGVRHILPPAVVARLAAHPLARDLYPRSFGFYPRARGHHTRRERHDDWLLLYCTEGRGEVRTADGRRSVASGDRVLLRRGTPHAYAADPQAPWSLYFVHFAGAAVADFLTGVDGEPWPTTSAPGLSPKLVADFDALLEARNSGFDVPTLVHAANHLRQMLCYLQALRPVQPGDGALLDAVHALMEQHLHDTLDLDAMAASVGLSRYHFAKRYKQLTGESPVQRFIHRKVQRACHLLDLTDQPVATIGRSLGYEDAGWFSRQFRRVTGLSPSAYRAARHG